MLCLVVKYGVWWYTCVILCEVWHWIERMVVLLVQCLVLPVVRCLVLTLSIRWYQWWYPSASIPTASTSYSSSASMLGTLPPNPKPSNPNPKRQTLNVKSSPISDLCRCHTNADSAYRATNASTQPGVRLWFQRGGTSDILVVPTGAELLQGLGTGSFSSHLPPSRTTLSRSVSAYARPTRSPVLT